jgi:molybdate transport system substrate-binding protein
VSPMATSPVVAWWLKEETITLETIERKDVRIAIADPEAAPFGKAAAEYLKTMGIYDELLKENRLVIMGNVEQAALAAKTGGADIGMFSLSVAKKLNEGSYVILPVDPLENSGGLVKGKATKNIEAFWHYIRSEASYDIWIKWGFEPVR